MGIVLYNVFDTIYFCYNLYTLFDFNQICPVSKSVGKQPTQLDIIHSGFRFSKPVAQQPSHHLNLSLYYKTQSEIIQDNKHKYILINTLVRKANNGLISFSHL